MSVSIKAISTAIVAALEANSCCCEDWSRVKAAPGFDPARACGAGATRSKHGDLPFTGFTAPGQTDQNRHAAKCNDRIAHTGLRIEVRCSQFA